MAYNQTGYDPYTQAYLNTDYGTRATPGWLSGDPMAAQANQQAAAGWNKYERQQDIEWANRQRMSDPSYWMNAFGMTSGNGSQPYQYSYEDTAAPYYQRLNALLDNPDSIANTGAYKFAFKQGNEAVNRNLAAKGLLKSGNRLSALAEFGQGLASQQYGAEADRLAGIAQGRRTGDIGKYQADTGRYSADVQGQNQLKGIMMNAAMNQWEKNQAPVSTNFPGGILTRW